MIFQRETSAFAGTSEYTFKHSLLRDMAYETVLKRERRAYHARVAEWLVAHSGERAAEVAGWIAEHLELAGQAEQTVAYLWQAREQALQVEALREARSFLERALAFPGEPGAHPVDDSGWRSAVLAGRFRRHAPAYGGRAEAGPGQR